MDKNVAKTATGNQYPYCLMTNMLEPYTKTSLKQNQKNAAKAEHIFALYGPGQDAETKWLARKLS